MPDAPQNERRVSDPVLSALQERMLTLHADIVEVKSAIKEVASALTKLALIEERQSHHAAGMERAFKALERVEARISEQERRIVELEKSEPLQTKTSEWVDRAVWGILSALVVAAAAKAGIV